jgi:hypothetical protein
MTYKFSFFTAPHVDPILVLCDFLELFSGKIAFHRRRSLESKFVRGAVPVTDDLVPFRLAVGNIAIAFQRDPTDQAEHQTQINEIKGEELLRRLLH